MTAELAEQAAALQDPAVLRERLIECGRDRQRLQSELAKRDRLINELRVQRAALQRRIDHADTPTALTGYAFDHWPD